MKSNLQNFCRISLSDKNSDEDTLVKMRNEVRNQMEHLNNKRDISSHMSAHKLIEVKTLEIIKEIFL